MKRKSNPRSVCVWERKGEGENQRRWYLFQGLVGLGCAYVRIYVVSLTIPVYSMWRIKGAEGKEEARGKESGGEVVGGWIAGGWRRDVDAQWSAEFKLKHLGGLDWWTGRLHPPSPSVSSGPPPGQHPLLLFTSASSPVSSHSLALAFALPLPQTLNTLHFSQCRCIRNSSRKLPFFVIVACKNHWLRSTFSLKMRWNMLDIYAILCDKIVGICKNCKNLHKLWENVQMN